MFLKLNKYNYVIFIINFSRTTIFTRCDSSVLRSSEALSSDLMTRYSSSSSSSSSSSLSSASSSSSGSTNLASSTAIPSTLSSSPSMIKKTRSSSSSISRSKFKNTKRMSSSFTNVLRDWERTAVINKFVSGKNLKFESNKNISSSEKKMWSKKRDTDFVNKGTNKQGKPRVVNATLYYNDCNPGVRAVMLLIKTLNIELEYAHLKNLAMYSMIRSRANKYSQDRTLPALDDDGFFVIDSFAIMLYLVKRFGGKEYEYLYPNDLKTKTLIEMQQQFYSNNILPTGKYFVDKMIKYGYRGITVNDTETVKSILSYVNHELTLNKWIAANHITIADFTYVSLLRTWRSIYIMPDFNGYPHLLDWLERCRTEMPGFKDVMLPAIETLKHEWETRMYEFRANRTYQYGTGRPYTRPAPRPIFSQNNIFQNPIL